MSSPTSTPKTPLPIKERKLKLRASCDSCAASKVKCSKEHPICARCSANGSACIFGVSRKHGKPGRTRKRNPDGTPFIKASKQRCPPDGREFGKFRIQPETMLPNTPDFEIASNWASDWSPTPSLPDTPKLDFEMTPEPFYMNTDMSPVPFMDNDPMPTPYPQRDSVQTVEHENTFRDPFAKAQSVQLDLPDIQALQSYIGGDVVNAMDYTFVNASTTATSQALSSSSTTHSPMSQSMDSYNLPMHDSISMPTTHCCYSLAYSTLESLKSIGADATPTYLILTQEVFDSVLSIIRLAAESVLQLLRCSCSSDPHLAMLYSSITSKILAWHQTAVGVNVTASASTSALSSPLGTNSCISSPLTVGYSSTSNMPVCEDNLTFGIQMQSSRSVTYELGELEQRRRRRQVVLGELHKCGQLVEALSGWTGKGLACEQVEFLYNILGAWLKSEMYKTVREAEAADAL